MTGLYDPSAEKPDLPARRRDENVLDYLERLAVYLGHLQADQAVRTGPQRPRPPEKPFMERLNEIFAKREPRDPGQEG